MSVKKLKDLTKEEILAVFDVDPERGTIERRGDLPAERRRHLNVGSQKKSDKQWSWIVNVGGINYQAVRLLWIVGKGEIPEGKGVRRKDRALVNGVSNNRLENLELYDKYVYGHKGLRKVEVKGYQYWQCRILEEGKFKCNYIPFKPESEEAKKKEAVAWLEEAYRKRALLGKPPSKLTTRQKVPPTRTTKLKEA